MINYDSRQSHLVALSKHFKRSNLAPPPKISKFHVWVKKCHLAIFQKGLGQLCPVSAALKNASYTVNIYRQKTILANGNTDVIPTTCKSFSLYREFFQPLQVNYHFVVNYPQTLKEFPAQAKGFTGSWNDIGISISQYSFLPINIYSAAFEKSFLFWMLMNIQKDWKAKLEST